MGMRDKRTPEQQAAYDEWLDKNSRADILADALRLCGELISDGLTPTLRQLYYRFVGTGLCPNDQGIYSRIGSVLADARMEGDFPVEWINDRTRSPTPTHMAKTVDVEHAKETTIEAIVNSPKEHIWMNRWRAQPRPVCVWVEKEALESVFERPCNELGVGLFACRGYPSISSLMDWINKTQQQLDWSAEDGGCTPEVYTILYFGDHDPDGLQIPVTAMETLRKLAHRALEGGSDHGALFHEIDVQLVRVGITLEQATSLNAPPFPAKVSSARFKGYVEKTGLDTAWELDALPPKYLHNLILKTIRSYFDEDVYAGERATVEEAREEFIESLQDGSIVEEAMSRIND